MTAPTVTRSLEENLEILRVLERDDLVDLITQLPEYRRAGVAACVVRQEAPVRAAILDASDGDLPALADRLISERGTR